MEESLWRRYLSFGRRSRESQIPRVLALSSSAWIDDFCRSLSAQGKWEIVVARTATDAVRQLAAELYPVVLCDRDLPGIDWRCVISNLLVVSPQTCFLLASRVSDEYLWREVVKHGGYDVVAKPLSEAELSQALQRAWYYWKSKRLPEKLRFP